MSRLRRDGVALFYEEAGVGELPMLLVHGLACAHTHLTPQLEHFSDDHRVVAVDLRGTAKATRPSRSTPSRVSPLVLVERLSPLD
jgi:pimeloyl-ACP methyl ester carboxylesterase